MNDFIKLSIQFINGEIDADTYYDDFLDLYYSRKGELDYPELGLFHINEMYNPDSDRHETELDENALKEQVLLMLEGKHPVYSDVSPVKVLTPSEVASPRGKPVKSTIHTKVLTWI